ncbi:hypothetical protein CYMTET_24716, partial [Cymbomonas tetramitiformis]
LVQGLVIGAAGSPGLGVVWPLGAALGIIARLTLGSASAARPLPLSPRPADAQPECSSSGSGEIWRDCRYWCGETVWLVAGALPRQDARRARGEDGRPEGRRQEAGAGGGHCGAAGMRVTSLEWHASVAGNRELVARFRGETPVRCIHVDDGVRLIQRCSQWGSQAPEVMYPATGVVLVPEAGFALIAGQGLGVGVVGGSVEVMLHRRLLQDDGRGLGKAHPLNDPRPATIRMLLVLLPSAAEAPEAAHHLLALRVLAKCFQEPPVLLDLDAPVPFYDYDKPQAPPSERSRVRAETVGNTVLHGGCMKPWVHPMQEPLPMELYPLSMTATDIQEVSTSSASMILRMQNLSAPSAQLRSYVIQSANIGIWRGSDLSAFTIRDMQSAVLQFFK